MSSELPPPVVEETPAAPLYDPSKLYNYIPYPMLTKEVLRNCFIAKRLRDNGKKNPEAQGQSVWTSFDFTKFKSIYPDFKFKISEDRMRIRTPFMHSPFGISCFKGKEKNPVRTIALSYARCRDDEVMPFQTWAKEVFDPFIVEIILENRVKWLSDEDPNVIVSSFLGLYRHSKEMISKGTHPQTGGFKLFLEDLPKAYHGETEIPANEENLPKDSYFCLDVDITNIWILKSSTGVNGTIMRIDMRTKEEIENPGFAVNVVGSSDAAPNPEPTEG